MIKKIKQLINQRVVNAGIWSMGGHGMSQVLRLASNLIMTRLLVPEMFGVMVIANMIIIGLSLFSDIGLGQNIIRSKRGDDPIFLNTVWAIQIVRGIIIWLVAVIVGVTLYFLNDSGVLHGTSVYQDPILPFVIVAISFSAIISGFESTKLPLAMRDYHQKNIALILVVSQFISIVSMIFWALCIERSIWALVIGALTGSTVRVILTHTHLEGHSNKWEWEDSAIKEIFHFGKWVFLSSLITFAFNNGDKILLGGLISPTLLGVYSVALVMINVFQTAISKLINATIYPTMSKAYHTSETSLKDIYYNFRIRMDSFISVLVGILLVTGNFMINSLYDDRYSEAGRMLQILSLALLSSRYMVTERYLLAIGEPRYLTYLNGIRTISLYALLPLGFYFYGFEGALWMIVLSYFSSVPTTIYFKIKYEIFDFKKEIITLPLLVISILLSKSVMLLLSNN